VDDDIDLIEEVLEIEVNGVHALGDPVGFIHLHLVPVEKVRIGVFPDEVTNPVKRAGEKEVIGVDPGHEETGGLTCALVDGVALALVRPGVPVRQPVLIFLQDPGTGIGGTAVYHDVLQVRVALVVDGEDGPLQKFGLVEGWGDDGDPRPCRVRHRGSLRVEQGRFDELGDLTGNFSADR